MEETSIDVDKLREDMENIFVLVGAVGVLAVFAALFVFSLGYSNKNLFKIAPVILVVAIIMCLIPLRHAEEKVTEKSLEIVKIESSQSINPKHHENYFYVELGTDVYKLSVDDETCAMYEVGDSIRVDVVEYTQMTGEEGIQINVHEIDE